MARHTDKTTYPVRELNIEEDFFFGEKGSTGKSSNFKASSIISGEFFQDNVLVPITTNIVYEEGIAAAVDAINNTPSFVISNTQSAYFIVPRLYAGDISESLYYDFYFLQNIGKGTYGVGSENVITEDNLLFFKSTEVYSVSSSTNQAPVVYKLTTNNVSTAPENVLNASNRSYEITNEADYFFTLQSVFIASNGSPKVRTFRFVGQPGIYGAGNELASESDFIEIPSSQASNETDTFLSLTDVLDNTYVGKLGFIPVVTRDLSNPSTNIGYKLKLTKAPQFSDIYQSNSIIRGGVIHISDLKYQIWASEYIINGNYYNDPVSKVVTLNPGSQHERYDVFGLKVNELTFPPTFSIFVLEGVPSEVPVKPTVDLTSEVEISFKKVSPGQTEDSEVETELIFSENTGAPNEWENVFLMNGGDLSNPDKPYIGSTSLRVPPAGLTQSIEKKVVSWKLNELKQFKRDSNLIFAVRSEKFWGNTSYIDVKLSNSKNNSNWIRRLTALNNNNFSVSEQLSKWRLISIPLSQFSTNNLAVSKNSDLSISNTIKVDTIELLFSNLPETFIDWVVIQGGVGKPENIQPVIDIQEGNGVFIDKTDPQRPVINTSRFERKIKDISENSYMIVPEDKDFILHFTNNTGCTVTIPNDLPANGTYIGKQRGDGQVNFTKEPGVKLNVSENESPKTLTKFSVFNLDCIGINEFDLHGDLEGTLKNVTKYDQLQDKITVDLPFINQPLNQALSNKVAKEPGKGLSELNFTQSDKDDIDFNSNHRTAKNNPHGINKSQVGLGNVDNTSDMNKPVSIPQGEAIDALRFTTDISLYLDPSTRTLRSNIGQVTHRFEWSEGNQDFVLVNKPVRIIYIAVNGQLLMDKLTQWDMDAEAKTITILDELDQGDVITINYQFYIIGGQNE